MNMQKRLEILEQQARLKKQERIRVWPDWIEDRIDRIMAMPNSEDFTIGMWGVVRDKDGNVVD